MPSVIVNYLIQTWTCGEGHVHTIQQDVSNAADAEQVARYAATAQLDGCQHRYLDDSMCGKPVKRNIRKKRIYL